MSGPVCYIWGLTGVDITSIVDNAVRVWPGVVRCQLPTTPYTTCVHAVLHIKAVASVVSLPPLLCGFPCASMAACPC